MASIFLALLPQIPILANELLKTAGVRVGKRSRIQTFTEVVFRDADDTNGRPDGLIVVTNGNVTWSALIEAKIGKAVLDEEQVARYVETARKNSIDAVITISNQFVARADHSPVSIPKSSLRKTGLFHWSWTWIKTQCGILAYQESIEDRDQVFMLNEFYRFLDHDLSGVDSFKQMGSSWRDLVQSVANTEKLRKTGLEVEEGVSCWFEEERDLCLQLSRHIGQLAEVWIEKRLVDDPSERLKSGISLLVENHTLRSVVKVPDCAADIEICADLARKTITTSMQLKAPLDRKSTKARVNWLLRMLKDDDDRLLVRAHWPGRAPWTQKELSALRHDPGLLQTKNPSVAPHTFEVLLVEGLGKRFTGRRTFIEDLERIVPNFYDLVGQNLRQWQAPPPKPIRTQPQEAEDTEGEVPDSIVGNSL